MRVWTLVTIDAEQVRVAYVRASSLAVAGFMAESWREVRSPGAGDNWHLIPGKLGLTLQGPTLTEPTVPPEWRCGDCGGTNVQFCWPVWKHANDESQPDDEDSEAQPYKDSDKTWCLDCETTVLAERSDAC